MLTCRVCGHANPDDERFCQGCSRFLEFTADPVAPTASPTPPFVATPVPEDVLRGSGPLGSQADVPTRQQPVVPAFGTGRPPGNSFPEVPDAGPDLPSGMRPSDVAERSTYRPPPVTEQEVIRPGDLVCPSCRTGNGPERTFCRRCGNQLRYEAPPPIYVPAPPSRGIPTRLIALGVGAVLALLAGFIGFKVLTKDDAKEPVQVASATTTKVTVTSQTSGSSSSVVSAGGAAPCPTAAVLNDVAKRPQTQFAAEGVPSEPGEVVLQFAVASPPAPSKSLVITICRTPGEVYHYFSRDAGGAAYGVYSTATNLGAPGFKAFYPNSSDFYIINGEGVTTSANVRLAPVEVRCANPAILNPSWKATFAGTAAPCTPANVASWKV